MQKFLISAAATLLLVVATYSTATAQSRIAFARGASSATISGRVAKDSTRTYTFSARKGQRVTVSVRSGNNYVFAGVEAVGQGRQVTGRLPYDGSYVLSLENGGNATTYTFTISIR